MGSLQVTGVGDSTDDINGSNLHGSKLQDSGNYAGRLGKGMNVTPETGLGSPMTAINQRNKYGDKVSVLSTQFIHSDHISF